MSRSPKITGEELISALARGGFLKVRTKGSQYFMRHADGRTTVVPCHSGETIGPGLLQKILRDCQLTRDDLLNLLNL